MANVFTLFGELKADTNSFQNSLRDAEVRLRQTEKAIASQEKAAVDLGKTSAQTGRSYEKLTEKIAEQRSRLVQASEAFNKGIISSKQMASVLNSTEKATATLNSRLKDSEARLKDAARGDLTFTETLRVMATAATKGADAADRLRDALKRQGGAAQDAGQSNLTVASQVGSIAAGAGAAINGAQALVSVFTSMARTAFSAAEGVFNFVKSASDFGSEIKDFQEKTGLAAATITTLKFAGEQGGVAFEKLAPAIAKFSKTVGEASKGSEQAAAKLTALGIDPQKAIGDLDGALGEVFKRINSLPPGIQQMTAAQDAFGKSGAELLPLIKAMGGDLQATIAHAKKLGVTLTEEDIKAADDFGDTLGLLGTQLKVAGAKAALEFAPMMTGAMNIVSQSLADNQGMLQGWSVFFSNTFTGAGEVSKILVGIVTDSMADINRAIGVASMGLADFNTLLNIVTLGAHNAAKDAFGTGFGSKGADSIVGGSTKFLSEADIAAKKASDIAKAMTLGLKIGGDDVGDYFKKFAGGADGAKKSVDKLTEASKELAKTWNSAQLQDFARGQGFVSKNGFETTGHNKGSLHGLNRAADVGLGASNPNRSVNDIVRLMANAIQAGIRIVDERVRPAGQKVWSAPHIHMEENDKRASSFNPNLDYGGKLEWLKALDKSRLAGTTKSVAEALGMLNKEGSPAQKLLEQLQKEFDSLTPTTKLQQVAMEMLGKGFETMTPIEKSLIEQFAKQIDTSKLAAEGMGKFNKAWDDLIASSLPAKTALEQVNELLASPGWLAAMETGNKALNERLSLILKVAAIQKDMPNVGSGRGDLTTGDPNQGADDNPDQGLPIDHPAAPPGPKVLTQWQQFLDQLHGKLNAFRASMVSLKTSIADSLTGSLESIGNIFANATNNWDKTVGGFFRNVAAGFAQMAQQIISELIRIAVMKAVLNLISSFAGGVGGGKGSVTTFGGGSGHSAIITGFASGGFTGLGRTSDVAGLVHKREFVMPFEAVKKWGLPFMEAVKAGFMPQMGFAGGGFTGGMMPASNSSTYNQPIVINIHGNNGDPSQVRESAYRGARDALAQAHRTQERWK